VAIFKNEADILKEWIDHHLEQGVDHFFLVNHNSTDNFSSVLSQYGRNRITLFHDTRIHSQVEIMNELIHDIKDTTEWIMSIDVDEFMYVQQTPQSKRYGSTVLSALSVAEKENDLMCQILVQGQLFGSSGHIKQPPSVRMNFTQCDPRPTPQTKFIIKSKNFVKYNVHLSDCKGGLLNECLTRHGETKCNVTEAVLRFNHYAILSWERFKRVKMTRGDVASSKYQNIRNKHYFRQYDNTTGNYSSCFELSEIVSGVNNEINNGR